MNLMNREIFWLGLILLQTALMFFPYILNLFAQQGIIGALRYYDPQNQPLSGWAQRAKAAHANAVENLVILAPAALAYIHLSGINHDEKGIVCALQIYFFSRIGHYIVYAMKLNFARTIFFFGGWFSTLFIIWKVLVMIHQ